MSRLSPNSHSSPTGFTLGIRTVIQFPLHISCWNREKLIPTESLNSLLFSCELTHRTRPVLLVPSISDKYCWHSKCKFLHAANTLKVLPVSSQSECMDKWLLPHLSYYEPRWAQRVKNTQIWLAHQYLAQCNVALTFYHLNLNINISTGINTGHFQQFVWERNREREWREIERKKNRERKEKERERRRKGEREQLFASISCNSIH